MTQKASQQHRGVQLARFTYHHQPSQSKRISGNILTRLGKKTFRRPFIAVLIKILTVQVAEANTVKVFHSTFHCQSHESITNLFLRYINNIIIIIVSLSQTTAGHRPIPMCAISQGPQLVPFICCQRPFADHLSIWPEDVLRYVYRVMASIQELASSVGCRFFDIYSNPNAT